MLDKFAMRDSFSAFHGSFVVQFIKISNCIWSVIGKLFWILDVGRDVNGFSC